VVDEGSGADAILGVKIAFPIVKIPANNTENNANFLHVIFSKFVFKSAGCVWKISIYRVSTIDELFFIFHPMGAGFKRIKRLLYLYL
jgi:hypothetical protein